MQAATFELGINLKREPDIRQRGLPLPFIRTDFSKSDRGRGSRFASNHCDARDVVGLWCALRELCHPLDDALHHLACRMAVHLEHRLLETLHTELSGLRAFGFGHAIGIE